VAYYQRDDVLAALERAVRFGAYSLAVMRRILAAHARPKRRVEELAEFHKDTLDPSLREERIGRCWRGSSRPRRGTCLSELAKGAAEAPLSREAATALERLQRR
jgi:hypothetical protein